jgi:hypothetical protein
VIRFHLRGSLLLLTLTVLVGGLIRPGNASGMAPDPKDVKGMVEKAYDYLKKHQAEDGSFSAKATGPGATALVVAGLLRHGYPTDDPVVSKAIAYLEKNIKPDGGIHDKKLANYTTSIAIMAFQEANKGGKYDTVLKNATGFLKGLQYGNGDGVKAGGVGYGAKDRPDLSNTQFFLEALLAAGVPKDDPAVQQAMKFVGRCQNLPGETNDQPFAKKTTKDDEGGLTYTPIDPDDSKHKTPDGGLRSLGAMTYAGLKSFLYAGVDKKDPRVKGAISWIQRHYTLEENPGMGQAGLFYYYHTFAKAMDALGEPLFEDAKNVKHDWRQELYETLKKKQKPDGSFINATDRGFGEFDPNIATAFALLTLNYVKMPAK